MRIPCALALNIGEGDQDGEEGASGPFEAATSQALAKAETPPASSLPGATETTFAVCPLLHRLGWPQEGRRTRCQERISTGTL